ncbi:uncharacterized protein LOC122253891 [Penaeus japonicus]|uniref:uncharacterized protein LOC122253891 n=1 Tax=Penaeus japonicus TaxID=27405 RepID=UPI001C70F8A4|nr:uncharacterized protein LOC122253891 [Penaeus japonicus]XP_042873237.1 uncharacterized protein LOC122253891 [Penaeus japonicus]
MASCAHMVDVMVGDLCLSDPPSILHRSKNPLCPVVAVQVLHGPLLYIPFLSPESVQAHLRDIHDGHNFLPLEIEESYLNGGKFVFRRGRSCLFTAPQNVSAEVGEGIRVDSQSGAEIVVGGYVNIVVLNGLCFPPTVFGRCKAAVPVSGRENGEPKRSLTGKVILNDHLGKSVASLQVSITLRSLGEDIALHAQHFDTGEERQSIPGVVPPRKFSEDLTVPDYDLSSRRLRLDKTINLLQEREKIKKTPSYTQGTVMEQSYVINQHFVDPVNGSSNYNSQRSQESSESIAMKIAEFERNVQDNFKEFVSAPVVSPRIGGKLAQPSPLLFTGCDAETERLWNLKMKEVGGYVLDFDNDSSESFSTSEGRENISENEDKTEEIEKIKKTLEKHKESRDVHVKKMNSAKERSQRSVKNLKNSVGSSQFSNNKKSMKHTEGMKRPTGWLRSTPIAPYRMHTEPPRPKLTRTSLLRRAKLDPELAKQLRAEVDFQVKQKLKILDEAFKEEMSNLRKKKLMRSVRQTKMTASSQTEDERAEDDLLVEIKPWSGLEDFSQQTDLFHQRSHQFTQMGDSFTREMDTSKRASRVESPVSHATVGLRKGKGGLQRGETYDVDVTERMGNTFSVKKAQINSPSSNEHSHRDGIFDVSTNKDESKKVDHTTKIYKSHAGNKTSKSTHKQTSDHSQSITESEPKHRRKGSNPTNRIRDSKMKPESTYNVSPKEVTSVRETSSESVQDDASIEENLVRSSNSNSSSQSMAIVTKSNSRRSNTVQSDYNTTNSETSEVSEASEASEASEVSEASNLSAEVYQEILRGKKADILMSNGSKSSRVQEVISISSAVEEVVTADDDSAEDVSQGNKESNILQQLSKARGKGLINSRTYSIKEGQGLDATYKIPVIHSSSSSENNAGIRDGNRKTKSHAQSQPLHSPGAGRGPVNVEVKYKKYGNARLQATRGTPSPRVQEKEMEEEEEEEEEGTVSDISARIAALLLPKKVEVASLHTDSISSYMPSDVDGTLSSLSDMS